MNAYEQLIAEACTKAERVERGAKHIKVYGPQGDMVTLSASVKRDRGRHVANARAQLRRIGINV